MKELEELIRRLDRIAKTNNDEFRYRIDVHALRGPGIHIQFIAIEKADGHTFVEGFGDTQTVDDNGLLDAVKDADSGIEDSCKEWGYKDVK